MKITVESDKINGIWETNDLFNSNEKLDKLFMKLLSFLDNIGNRISFNSNILEKDNISTKILDRYIQKSTEKINLKNNIKNVKSNNI
jgi:hypothetical protein